MTSPPDAKPLGPAELDALVRWAVRASSAWADATGLPADEVEWEVTGAICRALSRHDSEGTTVSAYVRQRVGGALLDTSKKQKRRGKHLVLFDDLEEARGQPFEDDDEALGRALGVEALAVGCPEAALLQKEAQAALDEELDKLPGRDKRLYTLRNRERLTWKEVSAKTGIPARTAQWHDHRILERLTAALSARYEE
jgi:RNA polymerase sigma factor (sigma-70 family)